MDKEESQLVYELAVKIFLRSVTANKEFYPDSYESEHQANWSIETARVFVAVAKERGLVKTPPGFNFFAEGEK